MKTKTFKIKIPDRLYDHITAKLVQNLLNVNYLEREKFVVQQIVTTESIKPLIDKSGKA